MTATSWTAVVQHQPGRSRLPQDEGTDTQGNKSIKIHKKATQIRIMKIASLFKDLKNVLAGGLMGSPHFGHSVALFET